MSKREVENFTRRLRVYWSLSHLSLFSGISLTWIWRIVAICLTVFRNVGFLWS